MRLLAVPLVAWLVSVLSSSSSCGTAKQPDAPTSAPAAAGDAGDGAASSAPADAAEADPSDPANDPRTRPEPHPAIPVGTKLVAVVGPRFVTGESFVPVARAVLLDETGRVRALLQEPPPAGRYPTVTLPGALAVAGLHDAHIHVEGIGQARVQVVLNDVSSPAEAKKRVAAWAKAHPDAAAVRGRGWDQSRWKGGQFPTWRELEGATTKPALLDRVDGHAAWANKEMLALAGITKDTKDPDGGKIIRDQDGAPTGVLVDNAIGLAESKLPPPSDADHARWLAAGLTACADAGLTAVHDMGMPLPTVRALLDLDKQGKLPLRVFVYLDGTDDKAYQLLAERPAPTDLVRIMGVKLYVDGAMGSRGAALLEDYADDAGNQGLLVTEPKLLGERIARAHALGYAAAVHAIGDRGNRVVLDAFAHNKAPAQAVYGVVRDRIEHAQLVAVSDIARFHDQHVVASMQPTHATSDMRWAEARVGKARLAGAYAWKKMLGAGVALAFGSDAPVEDERPTWGLYAALTRQDHDGKPEGGFLPEERLSQREALAAFAAGASYAVGLEQHLGALTPGMFFDVSLFDIDAAARADAGDPKAWLAARPVGTVVQGVLRAGGKPGTALVTTAASSTPEKAR